MDGLLVFLLIFGAVLFVMVRHSIKPKTSQRRSTDAWKHQPPSSTKRRSGPTTFNPQTATKSKTGTTLRGFARIIDGDTIVVRKTQIRVFGIDAPEINHPYGQKAKWALVALCKGKEIRVKVLETDTHGRSVGQCFLPNGEDLSMLMVKQGMAIDWPKFSGGKYSSFEVTGVRKKLWLADARQKGRMHVWQQFEARQKEKSENRRR